MICVIKIMYWSLCCLQVAVLACASCQILKTAGFACAGNAGNVLPPPGVSDPDMHHGTCVTHVPWCMPGSLTSGLLRRQWRGKLSHHSRRMRNPKFYVSGKRPISERKWESLVYEEVLSSTGKLWQHTRWYWGWIIIALYNKFVPTLPQAITCY